jgi:acid phosphatase
MRLRWLVLLLLLILIASGAACFQPQTSASETPAAPIPVQATRFDHVFVIVEENQNYEDVIGNTNDLPYLNALAAKYGVAANYYANTHPSINNYFYLTAGRRGTGALWIGELANNYFGEVAGDNIASILTANHKTWRAYAESIPRAGYLDGDHFPYIKHHNPFAYFANVRESSGQTSQAPNIVPFDNFARDLQGESLPNYSFIIPNLYNDGHNNPVTRKKATCGDHRALQGADTWLKSNMEPLIESPTFKRNGLLVIVFDEGCEAGPKADSRYDPKRSDLKGGGHVAAVIISSRTPAGTTRDELFHHESVLRLSLRALGIEQLPGLAGQAPDMNGFFSKKPDTSH